MLPHVADPAEWPAIHARRLDRWAPVLTWLATRLGVPDRWERLTGGEDSAVFATGDHVVKLVPPCYARDAAREAEILPRLDLPVPAPELRGVVAIDGWTALHVSRLPGRAAADLWERLPEPARIRVLHDLGALLAALRHTPLTPSDGDATELLDRLRTRATRHEAAGFPDVGGFLDRHLRPSAPAFVHFDLHTGNVMLDDAGRLTGVLDFVASRAFDPVFDVVTPGLFFGQGDPRRLRALVASSGLGDPPAETLAAWHLVHPFGDLARDLRIGRREGPASVEALVDLWTA